MENVKNNFEEMKKLLLGALEILEQTNSGLVERIQELEGRVEVLEERVKELEQQMSGIQQLQDGGLKDNQVADNEVNAPTAIFCAASAASMDNEVANEIADEIADQVIAEEEEVAADTEEGQTVAEFAVADVADVADEQTEAAAAEEEQTAEAEEVAASEQEQVAAEKEQAAAEEKEKEQVAAAAEEEAVAEAADDQAADASGEQTAAGFAVACAEEEHTIEEFAVADDDEEDEEEEAEEEAEAEAVGTIMVNDFVADEQKRIVNEAAKPDWYDWEVDYPAEYVDDVYKGISFNDRYEFIKELFNVTGSLDEAEMAFKETLDMINSLEHFKQVVAYIRERFPQWDEQSDEVYRFYMAVRRKFNK